jgi:hypothetical protein
MTPVVRTFTAAMLAISLAACGGGDIADEAPEASQNQGFVVVDDTAAPSPNANQAFVVVDDFARTPPGKTHPGTPRTDFVVVDD